MTERTADTAIYVTQLDDVRSAYVGGGFETVLQPRLAEGMIRVYLSNDVVVGFAHQYPRAFLAPEVAATLPTEKRFLEPSTERFKPLRERMVVSAGTVISYSTEMLR